MIFSTTFALFMMVLVPFFNATNVELLSADGTGIVESCEHALPILINETILSFSPVSKIHSDFNQIPISYSLENCNSVKNGMLNVHFILHTHNDVGWLKTPEQYYHEDVKQILFSAMEQLGKNKGRKFVYSEMYYFKKWWNDLNSTMRSRVTNFVKNGQLEFVGGGWVQNDEALSHYTSIIDQISYGLKEMVELFGTKARPAVGWQIDSFGYSKEQASLFAQFGYKAEVIQRLPWYDLERRRAKKDMEFYWHGDSTHKIFTHVLYDSYVAPAGFQYETNMFASENINDKNVKQNVQRMVQVAKLRSKSYITNHLMMLMGNDFAYKNASVWFDNIQKIIEHGNANASNESNINFLFSTPSCYLKHAMKSLENVTLTEKFNDFFPYCNNKVSMWTGYYSSRPAVKGHINKISAMLQSVQNLEGLFGTEETKKLLNLMREKVFTTLHHDGITGTCKQAVANDYVNSLITAESIGQGLLKQIHSTIVSKKFGTNLDHKTVSTMSFFCPLLNISQCPFSQDNSQLVITIFNGHSKTRNEYIKIPVDSHAYIVTGYDNASILHQVIENDHKFQTHGAKYSLSIPVNLPPVGFSTYLVRKLLNEAKSMPKEPRNKNYIENEFYKLTFNEITGLMKEVLNIKENKTYPLYQNFFWYENQESGAYIMRPTTTHIVKSGYVYLKTIEGQLVQEMRQHFNDWVTQIVRLYKDKNYIEVEWTVGPVDNHHGKEIVTRFESKIANGATFFTDANGRQMVERNSILPSSEPPEFPISAGYYPLTSMITIKDNHTQLMVVTDRATGGSSLSNGSLEFLVHRVVLYDDGAGMGEGLREKGSDEKPIVVRGIYRFGISKVSEPHSDNYMRDMAKDMFYAPIVMFSNTSKVDEQLYQFSALNGTLPDGVHLLTVQNVDKNTILIRLENYYQHSVRSVSLQSILHVKNCTETVLNGDIMKSTKIIDTKAIILEELSIKTLLCSY